MTLQPRQSPSPSTASHFRSLALHLLQCAKTSSPTRHSSFTRFLQSESLFLPPKKGGAHPRAHTKAHNGGTFLLPDLHLYVHLRLCAHIHTTFFFCYSQQTTLFGNYKNWIETISTRGFWMMGTADPMHRLQNAA